MSIQLLGVNDRILPMSAEGFAARGEAYLAKGQAKQALSECTQVLIYLLREIDVDRLFL